MITIVGSLVSGKTKGYKKAGTIKVRRIQYGQTKQISKLKKKLVVPRTYLVNYSEVAKIHEVNKKPCCESNLEVQIVNPAFESCSKIVCPDACPTACSN